MTNQSAEPTKLSIAIRTIRTRLGETQATFGKRVLVGQTSVSRWELAVLKPEPGALVALFYLAESQEEIGPIVSALLSFGVPLPSHVSPPVTTDKSSAVA